MKDKNPLSIKTGHSFYLEIPLLDALKQFAREQRRSVNFVVADILTEWVNKQKGDSK